MYDFEQFYQAKTIDDAICFLKENPEAVIISGGSDVLIKMREGKLAGSSLVSIHDLEEIKGIRKESDGTIAIGSASTFAEITQNEIVKEHLSVLGNAVDQAGGPQLRKVGTIGGNVCNGATSADSAPSLFILNAILVLRGPQGERQVPINEFYTGPGKTIRKQEEILTEIRIKQEDYQNFYGHYIKYGKRKSMEIATLGCACGVRLSKDCEVLEEVRLSYGVAAPTPIRCKTVEARLKGKELNQEVYSMIEEVVLEDVNPRSSWRASKEFRLQLVKELARRALEQAVKEAGGDRNA